MQKFAVFVVAVLGSLVSGALLADTLALADGTLLDGDFVGSSNGIVMFNTGDGIEAFPEDQVVGIFFSSGVATAEAGAQVDPNTVTIPAGTRLVIRTTDAIDSNRHSAGHRFRGFLMPIGKRVWESPPVPTVSGTSIRLSQV